MTAREAGYEAYVFFVIQMEHCRYFTPNEETHRDFAEALRLAAEKGVEIRAITCKVSPNSLTAYQLAEVRLTSQ